MKLADVYITGIGTRLGSRKVTVEQIGERLNASPRELERLRRKCGTTVLYRFQEDESFEACAVEACRIAMRHAGIAFEDVSGIYSSTGGPVTEYLVPDVARILADRMGIANIDTVGVSMGCVGGLDCVIAAGNRLVVDRHEGKTGHYLIVCGDHPAMTHRADDKSTAYLFSDGVACFVLTTQARDGYRIDRMGSVSAPGDPMCMKLRSPYLDPAARFEMSGEAVYEFAIKTALPAILELLQVGSVPAGTYCVFHQASLSILRQLAFQAGLADEDVYFDGIQQIGNTSGASVMFGLEDALKKNYIRHGSRVLLGAFGLGLKVGATLLAPVGNPRRIVGHQPDAASLAAAPGSEGVEVPRKDGSARAPSASLAGATAQPGGVGL
jgi:3-oxoacyl-[acyl-carrier-protein] synthase-3